MKNKKLWIFVGLLSVGLAAWASGYRDFSEGMRWGMSDGTANATMESSGALSINSDLTVGLPGTASTRIIEMKAAASQRESIRYWSGTDLRWNVQKDQDDDFKWTRYTGGAGGTFQDYPLKISSASGTVSLAHDLIFTERASLASTPAAGFGYLWVKNTSPSTLVFTDDTGTDVTLGSGGGGGSGTVTSIAISGSDGLEVDSGSPVTTSGTIALGLNKASVLTFLNVADGAEVNAVDSVNSQTGAVVLDADDISDSGTTNKWATAAEKSKLGNITITQAVDLDTLESDTATNNAKTSNATHTGEVTGSTGLTLDKTAITNRSAVTPATGDYFIFQDVSDSDNLKRATLSDLLALYSPSVTTSNTATLTNKRITPRQVNITSNSATPTLDIGSYDVIDITGQSTTITSMSSGLTGTPALWEQRRIYITGAGAVGITWGSSYASGVATLPSTTVPGKTLKNLMEWDGTYWRCMATGSNP